MAVRSSDAKQVGREDTMPESLFDRPYEKGRHIVWSEHMRKKILLGACTRDYQHFLGLHSGRCIVADLSGHTVMVASGAVKVGSDPPVTIEEFLARVARGERPWICPAADQADEDAELVRSFTSQIEATLDEED